MILFGCLALLLVQDVAAHGTHNARHGGVFFSTRDDTLHVEAVWPRPGTLKIYVTDEATRPLAVEKLRTLTGRVVVGTTESRLVLREHDRLFEARIPVLRPPAELIVELRIPGRSEPEGFQMLFVAFSDERALSFATEPTVIPKTRSGIVGALQRDVTEAERLIAENQSAFVFAPALRARDHAVALERHLSSLPADRRPRAEATMRVVVRTAWLLHTAGDDGTVEQTRAATAELRRATEDLVTAWRTGR